MTWPAFKDHPARFLLACGILAALLPGALLRMYYVLATELGDTIGERLAE